MGLRAFIVLFCYVALTDLTGGSLASPPEPVDPRIAWNLPTIGTRMPRLTVHITKENASTPDNGIYRVDEEVKYRCSVSNGGSSKGATLRLFTSGSTKPTANASVTGPITNQSIVFSKTMTTEDDEQRVYCEVVIDGILFKSEELRVRVLSEPQFNIKGATFIRGRVGDSMDMTCTVTNYHKSVPLAVTWYQKKNGLEVQLDCDRKNDPPSAILRRKLRESDQSTLIYCRATYENNILKRISKEIPIQLVLRPKVELEASVDRITTETTYKCSAKFEPPTPRSFYLILGSMSKGETKEMWRETDKELLIYKNATMGEGAQIFCVINCDKKTNDRCFEDYTYSNIYTVTIPHSWSRIQFSSGKTKNIFLALCQLILAWYR